MSQSLPACYEYYNTEQILNVMKYSLMIDFV